MIQLTDKSCCCGCAACVQRCPKHCISLEKDNEGFLYPKTDSSRCIECGLCEKVCPVLHIGEPHNPLQCYAAINPDEKIRHTSSSGGVFTAIATSVLLKGGVVFGAKFDSEWLVKHDYTESIEGLAAFRGSKYMQSQIGNTYRQAEEFLKTGRKVLFSGTPCQIAGLHRFLRKTYSNLLTIDFICHGVPSPMVWERYLQEVQELHPNEKITNISFRDKSNGWKKYKFTINFINIENKNTFLSEPFYQNIYMKGFLNDVYLRPSCHFCPAKPLRSGSDITMGDFWGIGNKIPQWDDDKGTSCILIHTEQGKDCFEQLNLKTKTVTYASILQGNPSLEKSPQTNVKKKIFFQDFPKKSLKDNIETQLQISPIKKIKSKIKRTLQITKKLFKI